MSGAVAVVATATLSIWLDKSIFRDEGASLYSAHLSWAELWHQSRTADLVLLPYYSFLHVWMEVSSSIVWARLPSLLAYGATVFLIGRLGVRLGGSLCGVLAALVAATNPLFIQSALDARPYALTALTCVAAAIALFRWLDHGSARWAWAFCLASLGTMFLQVFALLGPLTIVGVAAIVHPERFRTNGRTALPALGVLGAGVAAFVTVVVPQRGQIAWITFSHSIQPVLYAFVGPAYGEGRPYARWVLLTMAAGFALFLVGRHGTRTRLRAEGFEHFVISLGWAFLPAFILVMVSFVRPVYLNRYVNESVPGLAIALGLLLSRAFHLISVGWRTELRRAVPVGLASVAMLFIVATCSLPAARKAAEDLNGAARYLALHDGDHAVVALPDHALTTAIEYYVPGPRLKIWPEIAQPNIDGLDLRVDDAALFAAPDNVWLLIDAKYPPTAPFTRALRGHGFDLVGTHLLHGEQLDHYRRTAD